MDVFSLSEVARLLPELLSARPDIPHPKPLSELSGGKTSAEGIGDAVSVFELLSLLLTAVLAWVRPRQDLVIENLLLRHQLAVLTRPTRT